MLRAVATTPLYIGSFTGATLPAAASYSGMQAFASDLGANGTMVRSNGTRWLPLNGRALLKLAGASAAIANSETLVIQALIPAGFMQTGDLIQAFGAITKSGTTDTCTGSLRIGTAGTTADANVTAGNTLLSAGQVSGNPMFGAEIASATTALRVGAVAGTGYFTGASGNSASATTISNISNALYVSFGISSSGVTNTVALQSGYIELITG